MCLERKHLRSDELVVFAESADEDRGKLPLWSTLVNDSPERCLSISNGDKSSVRIKHNNGETEVQLRDAESFRELVASDAVLIDITGLENFVWPALLKAVLGKRKVRVLYAEPKEYTLHPSPASHLIFNLSASFRGPSPLPSFANLVGPENEDKCLLVSLLGFEGNRPERLLLEIDPSPKVIPIVGVPGFKIEYPSFTIACNRNLLQYDVASEYRFARASCPFEVVGALSELRRDYPEHYFYIAMVGTKPHALGAVCYSIENPEHTELMYDFPVRQSGRSKGVGLVHIYDLSHLT